MSLGEKPSPTLVEIGSDLSYDLIVALERAPEPCLTLELTESFQRERAEKLFAELQPALLARLGSRPLRARLRLFQRLPDPFVWHARLAAALDQLEHPEPVA